jgi:hypothetical protein
MAVIKIRTGSFFPSGLVFSGGIVAAAGFLGIFVDWEVGLPIFLTGLVVSTTHHHLIINTDSKVYRDCIWFFGYNSGASVKFDTIEYVFIKTSRESSTMYGRVNRTTVDKRVFDAYLKFSETDKIHIATRDSKPALLRKVHPVAAALKVRINDYSEAAAS